VVAISSFSAIEVLNRLRSKSSQQRVYDFVSFSFTP
jgi:hypothetical protein